MEEKFPDFSIMVIPWMITIIHGEQTTYLTWYLHYTKNWRLILHHQMFEYYILYKLHNTVLNL